MAQNQYGMYPLYGDMSSQNASKVYINPNFQRSNSVKPCSSSLHVNPQFHQNPNFQKLNLSKPKIYVNPNFVTPITPVSQYLTSKVGVAKINSAVDSYYGKPRVSINNTRPTLETSKCYISSASAKNTRYVNSVNSTITSSTTSLHQQNITPSRYCLVRQNNKTAKTTGNPDTEKIVTKMKINKYKTISLDHAKKQAEKRKSIVKFLPQFHPCIVTEKIKPQFIQSRFKLIKNMETKPMKDELRTSTKRKYVLNSKVLPRSNQKLKVTVAVSKFRKNNTPCPLFRKYGLCLRNSRGKCEFLHDKKHVSICRKFLKGICHDRKCLLSHNVSAEKMPTCSFYLRGMCTKEDCPYLHVKLNEKALVCPDFVKGYCEKGDKCLNRHENICPDQALKGVCLRRSCSYPHSYMKKNVAKKERLSAKVKINKEIENKYVKLNHVAKDNTGEDNGKDCRYYKEVLEDMSPLIEVIKPTRCKLGALPSFIQL